MAEKSPTVALRAGRRALEGLVGVRLLEDWIWWDDPGKWTLRVLLSVGTGGNDLVPPESEWFILVDEDYPQGRIKFYPAKNGLALTFPHQSYNGPGRADRPWRAGDLCLVTSLRALGRNVARQEPSDMHWRLRWHFERALIWLEQAARGELSSVGDPFELPEFPGISASTPRVVFAESEDTFSIWQTTQDTSGPVELWPLPGKAKGFFIKAMKSPSGQVILTYSWGRVFSESAARSGTGIWLRIGDVPFLPPWQAPSTWGELQDACKHQGIDLNSRLRPALNRIRDGRAHLALIGFPVPMKVGEPPRQMHWQAVQLPVVSWGKKTADGFRPNELGYWQRDHTEILRADAKIEWLTSENWHADQLTARGGMPKGISDRKVLVIGAGALGSAMAELLVRAGVREMVIADGEVMEAGNLVRHTLGMEDLGASKAAGVAARLNQASPHASISAVTDFFPPREGKDRALAAECDIVIDASASDELPAELARFPWSGPRLFFSVSLGFKAERLYCFAAAGEEFPARRLFEALSPWLSQEAKGYSEDDFPWEGVGCWHPVFPARVDDIWLLASAAVKHMVDVLQQYPIVQEKLTVFEQQRGDGNFTGVREVRFEAPIA